MVAVRIGCHESVSYLFSMNDTLFFIISFFLVVNIKNGKIFFIERKKGFSFRFFRNHINFFSSSVRYPINDSLASYLL
jgi:hypothetical protein